jgi:Uma2 family endonuclease
VAQSIPHRTFTVDEYSRLYDVGILPRSGTELIGGQVLSKKGHGGVPRRWTHDEFLQMAQSGIIRPEERVRVQNTFRLDEHATPEPDILLLRPSEDFYLGREAGPGDALLVIEVSDTTLSYDRGVKRALYARYEIPELWIVDVERRTVIVHRAPRDEEYREVREFGLGDAWDSPVLDGRSIRTEDVLGPLSGTLES